MPIMAIYRVKGIDAETFNRYRVEVPIEPIPKGAISHHVAFDGKDLVGFDIWETVADQKAFTEQRVNPGLRRMGIPITPPQVLELHALWTAGDGSRHNVAPPPPKDKPSFQQAS